MADKDLGQSISQVLDAIGGTGTASLTAEEQALLEKLATRLAALRAPARQYPDETAVRQRERFAQIHFDYSLSGIIETDSGWHVLRANPAAASITGRNRKNLLTLRIDELFAQLPSPRIGAHFSLLLEQGISHSELQVLTPGGEQLNIGISSIQAEENRFMHIIDDVTEDRRKSAELLAGRQAAEAANLAKGEFLANVSHEIRTPMHGIIGLIQLVLMTELTVQQRDYLNKIVQSSKTQLKMLNDLLDFAKIESGKLEFERREVDLYEVLDELAVVAAHSAIGKTIELVFEVERDTPRFMLGDRLRLTQILINLISNAVKFTDDGHVVLVVSAVPGSAAAEAVRFSVSDTGNGISAETLGRLFKPFAQADAATTRRYGGTGLGLVIAQQLARGMGGELSVNSVWGQGSTFSLELPYNEPERSPVAADPYAPFAQAGSIAIESSHELTRRAIADVVGVLGGKLATSPDAGLRIHDLVDPALELESLLEANACPLILLADAAECARLKPLLAHRRGIEVLTRPLTPLTLARAFQQLGTSSAPAPALPELAVPREFGGATVAVAEDMMVNQQVIVGLLEKAGIRVCLAENGKALLEMLATATTPPELIFMDLHMPEMDGFEAARALRAKGYPHPIIALSAGVSAQEQSRCTDAGMNDFLAKPIDLDELWGVLTRWLKPRESPLPPITQSRPSSAPDGGMLADAGILVEEALTRFLGDAPALQRAIGAFIEQHRRDADAMRTLLQANEQRNLEALAHGLKGAAATIGARQLESLARTLEHLPGPLPRPEVQSIIDDVAAGISRIEKAARSRQLSDGR